MMFLRADVVPILAKSRSALPGSCRSPSHHQLKCPERKNELRLNQLLIDEVAEKSPQQQLKVTRQ
jgi:hypothetical protein